MLISRKPVCLALATVGLLAAISLLLAFVTGSSGHVKVALALEWTKTLAGILVTVAGVAGAGVATVAARNTDRVMVAGLAPGVVGALAGTTLLGASHWGIPAALGAAGLGTALGYGLRRP